MNIEVRVQGKKGAVPRYLRADADRFLSPGEMRLPGGIRREVEVALQGAVAAANKLIARAARGAEVFVAITVMPDPIKGWSASLLVDVTGGEERT